MDEKVHKSLSILNTVFSLNSIYIPFGRKFPPYTISKEQDVYDPLFDVQVNEFESNEQYVRLSQFGTPILSTFVIGGGNYKVYDNRGQLVKKQFNDFEIPAATIIEFSRSHANTSMPVLSGASVKEIYGINDWKITIRGVCLNDDSRESEKNAYEQQLALESLNAIADSLAVKGKVFGDKDIYNIAIEDFSIKMIQGKPNVIPFEIQATSDQPIELFGL